MLLLLLRHVALLMVVVPGPAAGQAGLIAAALGCVTLIAAREARIARTGASARRP